MVTEPPEIPAGDVVPQVQDPPQREAPPPAPEPLVTPPEPLEPSLPGSDTRVRVGLATDLEEVELPCCDGILRDPLPKDEAAVGTLKVTAAPETSSLSTFRLQVAALKDEGQAEALAQRLKGLLGDSAEARFDAGSDLYRVRGGSYATREAAEAARGRLAAEGFGSAWVVSDGGGLEQPALIVRRGERAFRVEGRRFPLEAPGDEGILWEGTRYRNRLVVYLNDRGRLNVINELPLEDYLRGVVPKEMGPLGLRRDRSPEGPGGGGPKLHPAPSGGVRGGWLRYLRHPPLPCLRRSGRRAAPDGPGHRRDRPRGLGLQ